MLSYSCQNIKWRGVIKFYFNEGKISGKIFPESCDTEPRPILSQ